MSGHGWPMQFSCCERAEEGGYSECRECNRLDVPAPMLYECEACDLELCQDCLERHDCED